jgi:RND family efflux transporter MFP subunit
MRKHKKKIIWLIVILALIAGGVFYLKNKKTKVTYTTVAVKKGNLIRTVSVTGTVTPPQKADLSFKSSGKIIEIGVSVGDKVKKGQKLAVIDTSGLQSQLAQAQAEVTVQKQTLQNIKNHSGYNSNQENAQRAQVEKAAAGVNQILSEIKDAVMVSPIDGFVSKKNYEVGETATAGSAVLSVSQQGDLEIDTDVPESDIIKISLEQNAVVTPDAFPDGDILNAKIFDIEPSSTVIQDVVYYKVKLKFEKLDDRLKDGMSADIDVNTAEKDNVLMVPRRAIKTEGDKKTVQVLRDEKKNIVDTVTITTGLEGDEGMVEMISGNLKEGDKVVTFTK